jgi:hypothetical protein
VLVEKRLSDQVVGAWECEASLYRPLRHKLKMIGNALRHWMNPVPQMKLVGKAFANITYILATAHALLASPIQN